MTATIKLFAFFPTILFGWSALATDIVLSPGSSTTILAGDRVTVSCSGTATNSRCVCDQASGWANVIDLRAYDQNSGGFNRIKQFTFDSDKPASREMAMQECLVVSRADSRCQL